MNDFDCDVQIEDTRDFADWVEYQLMQEAEEMEAIQQELNEFYDSQEVTPDTLEDMYDLSLPSLYALNNGLV